MDRLSQVRVVCVAGARPNFVKVAPLLRALRARPLFDARLVHTGQHRDPALSSALIEELGIPPPDAQLGSTSGSHAHQTAEIMRGFEEVLAIMQPHVVVVFGDVDSTLACALACAKFGLREPFPTARSEQRRRPLLVHVEAGLRSFDDDMPEEVNRRITDALSDLLCASEPAALANLQREGIPDDRIVFAGNVMIDSLTAARDLAGRSPVLDELGLKGVAYGVVTLHRPANVDDPVVLHRILRALDGVARELPLVFPVHPRTRERLAVAQREQVKLEAPRWRVIEPLGYAAFLRLLGGARAAFTDSGGVQEETTVLGVPCLTLRDTTERPITVEQGTNQLVGTRPEVIAAAFRRAMTAPIRGSVPRAWDGNAAERIADHLQRLFEPTTTRT